MTTLCVGASAISCPAAVTISYVPNLLVIQQYFFKKIANNNIFSHNFSTNGIDSCPHIPHLRRLHQATGAKEFWRAKAPPKVNLYSLTYVQTVERHKRHSSQDDDSCALCDQEAETGPLVHRMCVKIIMYSYFFKKNACTHTLMTLVRSYQLLYSY